MSNSSSRLSAARPSLSTSPAKRTVTGHAARQSLRFAVLLVASLSAALSGCNEETDAPSPITQTGQALTFTETAGIVSIEAENFTSNTAQGSHSWASTAATGASGGTYMLATPNNGAANNTGYTTSSPRLDYQVTFAQSGTYRVWMRGRDTGATAGSNDSVHVGLNGVAVSTSDRISGFTTALAWTQSTMDSQIATFNVPSAGVHTVNVWMREDGFAFDKLVLTQNTGFTPTGLGPTETSNNEPPPSCTPTTYEAENMTSTTGGSVTGGWNIWSDGNISTSHGFTAGARIITVTAQGTQAVGVWPNMIVSVGGTQLGQVSVSSTAWAEYSFPFTATAGNQTITVAFNNDYYDQAAGADRNLLVDKVVVTCPGSGCAEDDTQPGTTSCGLNDRGVFQQLCASGEWEDTTTCLDPDQCVDDDTQPSSAACGLNDRGTSTDICVTGQWQDSGVCDDPDECVDDSVQIGATTCGLNDRGGLEQLCNLGTWEDTATCVDPDECVDDSVQAGTTACGFNGRGALDQLCVTGSWQDTATCVDPDVCTDSSTQPGTTACGLNGRGVLQLLCTTGNWAETGTCLDPDECVDDATQQGAACGLNGRGTQGQLCVSGNWTNTGSCNDPDECVDDSTQPGAGSCGLNGRGTPQQLCVTGNWQDTSQCADPDVCVDDATQSGTTVCGLNNRGTLDQLCVSGAWADTSSCADPDVCVDNNTQPGTAACGLNGRGTLDQICTSGQWQDSGSCVDPDVCVDNATQPGTTPCGGSGILQQICSVGQWIDSSTCVASDRCGDDTCGGSEACDSCAIDCGACSYPSAVYLEAELGTLTGSPTFTTVQNGAASGGQYILPASNSTGSPGPNRASYTFNVSAGTYRVWMRGNAANADDDSVWFTIDGGTFVKWNDFPKPGWVWDDGHNSDAGGSVVTFTLTAGTHTLNIANRENGFFIDKFYITKDGDTPSGVGGPDGVCGDALCSVSEDDCSTCISDCGSCAVCNDGETQAGGAACGLNGRGALQQLCVAGAWADTSTCIDPDVCVDDAMQPTSVSCGLNDRGTSFEICVTGHWQDSGVCDDPDECVDDSVQIGATTCGLNDRGGLEQLCNLGTWEDTATCVDPDECVDDSVQAGITACGLNGRGALDQVCVTGSWQDTATCVDPDVCTDSSTQPGTTACGLNGRGVLQLLCTAGNWAETGTCLDPDECVDDATQQGAACGLNGRGTQDQLCVSGNWTNTGSCNDPDECVDASTQPGTGSCGLNGRGTLQQLCVTGTWQDTSQCDDPDVCVDDATQAGATACGLNNRGALDQLCVAGAWTDTSTCVDPDVCTDNSTQPGTVACGLNNRGTLEQLCALGQWQDSSTCDDPDACVDDTVRSGTTPCGNGGTLEQLCSVGQWTDSSNCIESGYCGDGTCGGSEACDSCAIDCGACAYPSAVYLEAELGTLSGSPTFSIAQNGAASGGAYLLPASNTTASAGPNRAAYTFNVSAGTYTVWMRGNAASADDDSVWFTIDGGTFVKWNEFPGGGWVWDDGHNSDAGGSVVTFNLSEGTHTLNIANRENGFFIDKFYITKNGDTPSGLGGSDGVCGDALCSVSEDDCNSCISDCGECNVDSDNDGVLDADDWCPGTPLGVTVDEYGCETSDLDGDGVSDFDDQCPNTTPGDPVDAFGCSTSDADGDGVPDSEDECPDTVSGTPVDSSGCPFDDTVPEWVGPAPPDSDFETEILASGLNEPMAVEMSTSGQIYLIGRNGEFYAMEGGSMNIKSTFATNTFEENGLIGFALDPNFATNRWAYFHYTHPTQPQLIVSRIPINTNNTLNFASESVLLTYNVQMEECCHAAGALEFGPDGNLFIATGDNTNASDYGQIDERPGQHVNDAQKSSSNTNDLRGKILRITPTSSGGYTIPPGNLFAGDATHRAEIFVMGNRNPYRIAIDQQNGELFWGEVGPDANSSSSTRGPTGYDEINRTLSGGFFGWPYFSGFNEPYNDYNFATGQSGPLFNPQNVTNNSPNNTGAFNLPNAQGAWVRMSHRATMVGGVYRWDNNITDLFKLPSYFHGRLLYWNFNNDQMFEAPVDSSSPTLRQWLNTTPLNGIIDGMISRANGRLYLVGYGGNCCNKPGFAGQLVEVRYVGEGGQQTAAESYAINSAGSSFVSNDGTTYAADTLYSGGEVSSETVTINGTTDQQLYQTHRWQEGGFSYALPLVNDEYQVTLKFAETYFSDPGMRSFHVDAEGQRMISSLDVYALVGEDTAYDRTFTVTVTDGDLNLDFVPEVENPFIAGIVVKQVTAFQVGTNISLQAGINGKYVTADASSAIASANSVSDSETFTIVDGGSGTIALQSAASGLYLSVAGDANSTLSASASSITPTERFELLENLGGFYVLVAATNGKYVTASNAGDGVLTANSTTIGGWQIFSVSPVTLCEPAPGYGVDCRPQSAPYLNMPVAPNPTFSNVPALLSQTGAFADVVTMQPSAGMIPFEPISRLWSDRADKTRWVSVPSGATIGWAETGKWDYPAGTVFVKHFELPIDEANSLLTKRLETRLLMVQPGGTVYGVTYKWRDDGTEADLLTTILEETITIGSPDGDWDQVWTYPGPSDCLNCHNDAAEGVLGAKTAALNGDWQYPSGVQDNQLRTWNHLGLFNQQLNEAQLSSYPAHAALEDVSKTPEHRLRSYWDINCGHCHGTLGIASLWDARFDTPLGSQGIISGPLANQRDYLADYGLPNPYVVDPGDPLNSILFIRDNSEATFDRMPPLARALRDEAYINLLEQWINSL